LFFVISNNRSYQDHFESLIVGRADRSSEGRFYLWERGLEVLLDRNVFTGVGPENFRVVDEQAKQLHNDLLAFGVERGLLGALGLVILGAIAVSRAFYMLQMHRKYPQRAGLVVVVFMAAIAAMLVASLTHQVFHSRELWLVLASQEAMFFKMTVVHHDEYSPADRNRVGKTFESTDVQLFPHRQFHQVTDDQKKKNIMRKRKRDLE